jgi:hypothetical protein
MSTLDARFAVIEQRLAALEKFQRAVMDSLNITPTSAPQPAVPAAVPQPAVPAAVPNLRGVYVHMWNLDKEMMSNINAWLASACGLKTAVTNEELAAIVINVVYCPGGRADVSSWKKNLTSLPSNQKHYLMAFVVGSTPVTEPEGFVKGVSVFTDDSFIAVDEIRPENPIAATTIKGWISAAAQVQSMLCARIGCSNTATLQCSGCERGKYCSRGCGRDDWVAGHAKVCGL